MERGIIWSGDLDSEARGCASIGCFGDVVVEKDGENKLEGKENQRRGAETRWREKNIGRCDCATEEELDWTSIEGRWTVEGGNGGQTGRKEAEGKAKDGNAGRTERGFLQ